MNTMNIALPETMTEYIQSRVSEGGYSSASEYIRTLIRADQQQQAHAALEVEILKGLRGGATPMTPEDWRDIRQEVRRRHASRKQKQG